MKKIIVNADDFGMNKAINSGIKKGIRKGVITSVSVMANMPGFNDAADFLKQNRNISVGLHFNLTEGFSLSETTSQQNTLFFSGLFKLILTHVLNKNALIQSEKELTLQYLKLKKSGVKITHIDSHQHIHLYPPLFNLLLNFAGKHKIPSIRCARTFPNPLQFFKHSGINIKQQIITNGYLFNYLLNSRNRKNLLKTNFLYDLNWTNNFNQKNWNKLLSSLPNGTTEIICHPSIITKDKSPWSKARHQTLVFLSNPKTKESIIKQNILVFNKI